MSLIDALVDAQAVAAGLTKPVREFKFHPERRWRADYFWPYAAHGNDIALEVEGGVWTKGRHTRGSGFVKDMEKYNAMAAMGIRLIRLTPQQVKAGELKAWLEKMK